MVERSVNVSETPVGDLFDSDGFISREQAFELVQRQGRNTSIVRKISRM
jgi:hypothetical protein